MEGQWEIKDFNAEYRSYENWSIQHSHSTFEIFFLVQGEKGIMHQNKSYHLKPGYVFLCAPDFVHSYMGNGKYSRYMITFSKRFLETYFTPSFRRLLTRCFTSEVISLNEDEQKHFVELFEKMNEERTNGGPYPLQLANIMNMLDKASERKQENPILPEHTSKEMAAIVNVVTYINSHYREIKSMDEITQACFISKSYLCHIFKKEYNMTVMEYLKRVRIRYACEFLATSDKTFSLIATKMGFADISHFTKNFKKIMGCTPREYREMKKKERTKRNREKRE